jgi:tRNA pseudouridine55 synthase
LSRDLLQSRRISRRAVDGILLLDKPSGISSNDALQRAKRVFRAAKAGHTGSLDPLATGVLPLCFGEATKLCGVLLESDKRYRATAKLGERTDTGDSEGRVVECSDLAGFDRAALMAVLPGFTGVISQIPPMYSALKHQGQPLYALAREGIEIERKAREVTIFELNLVEFDGDRLVLDVRCSKGTYIRTLIEDIARAAGQCAHLIALRRTMVVPFEGEKLISFEQLDANAASDAARPEACATGLRCRSMRPNRPRWPGGRPLRCCELPRVAGWRSWASGASCWDWGRSTRED